MKKKIKKYNGIKLIAAASALTILSTMTEAIVHPKRESENLREKSIYIPEGVNLDAYDYAYQNNKNVVKLGEDYYEWDPLRNHQISVFKTNDGTYNYIPEEGDVVAFNMKTSLPESVSLDELTLLTLQEKYEVLSNLPEGGQFVYEPTSGKIVYQYYDSNANEFVLYEIKETSKENKLLN